jgi:hypothetical protein
MAAMRFSISVTNIADQRCFNNDIADSSAHPLGFAERPSWRVRVGSGQQASSALDSEDFRCSLRTCEAIRCRLAVLPIHRGFRAYAPLFDW